MTTAVSRPAAGLLLLLALCPCLIAQPELRGVPLPATVELPNTCDLTGSFTFRMCVRLQNTPDQLPTLAANKPWESGEVRDYTTNNSFGLGRASGKLIGFAISNLPDGAWTWNAGDGKRRIDHRPEAADQSIADGRWHEVGFAIDRTAGVAHLYHDGRRVALHDLQGIGSLASPTNAIELAPSCSGAEIAAVRIQPGALTPADVRRDFRKRFGVARTPPPPPIWNGQPLRILAWNIWHGGRRKGRDEGVQRVVEVIRNCRADLVLMQETYGSGPRISGRLGFDYFLRSSNLSILSRYPIVAAHRLASGFRFGGATIQLAPDQHFQAYSLWIDYLPSVQKQLADGATGPELAAADQKTRGRDIDKILQQLTAHLATTPGIPVIVGGDFNSGSHLDWTKSAAQLDNHHGLAVTWPVSLAMQDAGFVDAFRTANPDPLASPGHTWSPEFPESHQDRIDYVYLRGSQWRTLSSRVLRHHDRGWPSDHAAAFASVDLIAAEERKQPTLKVMSYNIHYAVGMDKQRDLARIAQVILDQQPDIVGLQEIGNEAMANELGRLTGMPVVFGPAKGLQDQYGDAILCRHPFVFVANHAIPSASSSRYQAMAIDVDVSATFGKDQLVRIVNTHFDWLDTIGSKQARLASVDLIRKAFLADTTLPVILTGDLNAEPGSEPLRRLFGNDWAQAGQRAPLLTIGEPSPDRQIDYALAYPQSAWQFHRTYVVNEAIASDHRPIVTVLGLR